MNWVKRFYFKHIALAVILGLLIIGSVPTQSLAYVAGPSDLSSSETRARDIDSIQRVLESKLIASKLVDAGLSMDEVKARLDKLSDEEVHSFAAQLDSLYPGGDALGVIIAILVIVILVIVILKLQNKKIVIS